MRRRCDVPGENDSRKFITPPAGAESGDPTFYVPTIERKRLGPARVGETARRTGEPEQSIVSMFEAVSRAGPLDHSPF